MSVVRQNAAIVVAPNVSGMIWAALIGLNPVAAVLINNGSAIVAEMNGFRPLMGPPGYKELQAQREAIEAMEREKGTAYTGASPLPATIDGTAVAVAASTPATSGTNGVNGTNGTHAVNGVNGHNGTNGTNGHHAKNGVNGVNGANGHHSMNGTNGTNGQHTVEGLNGHHAENGVNGHNGTNGTNGTNGSNGANGYHASNGSNGTNGSHAANGTAAAVLEPALEVEGTVKAPAKRTRRTKKVDTAE
jgi:hypothetical protein